MNLNDYLHTQTQQLGGRRMSKYINIYLDFFLSSFLFLKFSKRHRMTKFRHHVSLSRLFFLIRFKKKTLQGKLSPNLLK